MPIVPGGRVTFNITVYNQGTIDAYDINVNDYIPTGLSLTDSDWSATAGTASLLNEIPFLADGDNIVIPITFTVDANFQGDSITNFAEIGFAASEDGGPNAPDIDSDPDGDDSNDGTVTDNVNDNSSGDEDDHDPAGIAIEQTFDLALTKVYDSYGGTIK